MTPQKSNSVNMKSYSDNILTKTILSYRQRSSSLSKIRWTLTWYWICHQTYRLRILAMAYLLKQLLMSLSKMMKWSCRSYISSSRLKNRYSRSLRLKASLLRSLLTILRKARLHALAKSRSDRPSKIKVSSKPEWRCLNTRLSSMRMRTVVYKL